MGYSSHGCRTEVSSSAASQHPLRLRHALQTLCAATSPSSAESRVTGRGLSVRSPLASSARSSCLSSSKLATSSRSSPPASRAYSCPRVASFVFPSSSVEMPARAGARDLQCDEAPVFSQADPSRGGATPRPASCVESPQAAASMGRLSRLSSPQALRATARRGALRVVASACALLFVFLLSWAVSPSPPAPPASFPVWLPSVAPVSAAPARSQQLKIGPAQVLLPSPPPAPDARVATPLVSVRTLLIVEQNGASLSSSSSSPCFYWTAQHPDTIRLLRPDCAPSQLSSACLLPSSSSAALSSPQAAPALCLPRVLVEAAVPAPHRRGRSWIFASPTAQGGAGGRAAAASGVAPSAMRVQAVVAPIARLAFRTRDRRLAVGQLGDVGVLAFDEEGNIFTSLQGLVFLWRFEGEKGVLQAEPITGDAEAATPTRRWVEKTSEKAAGAGARARTADSAGGLVGAGSAGPFWRSDMLLVRGLKTGRATIIVRLAGEYYQHVGEARVSFVVHEPVLLLPSFQVLPPAAVFQYRLLRLREQAESQAGAGFPRALRGPSYVELPAPHWQFSATDLAVYDAQDRLPLERATDAASAASSLVSIDPSGLLRVVAPPAFPGEGEQATRFGLEGATLLRAVDMRTGEEQHAKVFVLQPSALRLFVDDIQALRQQDVWRQLVLAVRRQMGRSAGADSKRGPHSRTARAEETHASELLLLSKLAERAWAAPPAGHGRQPEDEQAEGAALGDDSLGVPPTELLMSLVKTGGEAEGHDDDVLYLVRGREYLCKVEMLAASLSQGFAPLSDAAGDPPSPATAKTAEDGASPAAESVERAARVFGDAERDAQLLVVTTPKNAVFHWSCASEEDEEDASWVSGDRGDGGAERGVGIGGDACGLQRKGSAQQFLAWFVAARRSQGRLTASLMHVGSLASSAAPNASWKPPAPLSISLRFRVVDPVSLLFFPRESAPAPEGEEGVRLSTDQPLLLPPLHSFIVEPWGGSGRYTLTSSDPSLVTVAPLSASPASPPFASSNLLSPLGWGVNTPTPGSASPPAHAARPRFRLETTAAASAERVRKKGGRPATGAAVLRLQDARQPQNSFEFLVIVAEPERVEITVDTYLIQQGEASYREDGRREALDAAQANMQQRAAKADGPVGGQTPREDVTHAIAVVTAYARIPPTLALPANVSNWLSQSSLSSSAGPRLTSLDAAARAVRRAASKWSEEVSEEDATEEDAWVSRHPLHLRPLQFASCNNLALLRGTAEATDDSPQFWTDAPGVLAISELRSALPYTCGVFRLTGTAPGSARFFFSASPRSAAAPAAGALTASVALDVFPPLEAWVLLDRLFLPAPLPSRKSPHLRDSLLDFAGPSEGGEAASTSWTAGEAEPGDTREGALHRIERRGLPRGAVAAGLPSRASPLLYSAPVSAVASRYREASASSAPAAGGARASEEILTLAVGSSLTFFTKGGPPDRPSAYVQLHGGELEPDAPEGTARVGLVSGDSEDFLRVVCLQPGTAAAKVALKTTTLPRKHIDVDAVSTSVRVWIMCSIPEHIEIFPLPTFSSLFGVAASSSSPRAPAALSPSSSFPLTPATVSFPQISPLSLSSPSTPSLFLRCGATHRFFFVSYDANLRPMLNVTSFFSSSPDTWELAGVPAPADQAGGAQTDRDRASLVPFFGADSDSGGAGRRAAGAKETAKTEAFAAVDGVGVAVDSEACCGTLSLSVHLTWPAETAAALRDAALQEDAQRLLLSSLDAARESLRQRENRDASGALRSSAWRGDKLAETLFLVVLPPSRFFVPPPSPAFVPGFFPPLGDPAVSALAPQPSPDAAFPVRLFYHPQLVYRLLLQFTSPHSQVKARAASTSFSSGPSSVFGLFVETPGPRLLADGASHSAFFSALSPDQTLARFEARFRAAYRGDRAAASSPADARAESTRAPFPQDGLDVTSLVLRSADASQKPHPQSLPAALFPLRRPYAWPRGAALCSATCPLTEQEVWVVPPVTASSSGAERPETGEEDESAPPRRGRPAASGLLTVEDAGMVGDDAGLVVPGAEEEAAERKSAPTRTLELQFLRVERVSLSVLPPESLLAGSRRREAESRARHGWISGNWGEIEKGRTYGVKVDVIASDGAKLDPAFFRAMDLSLKISRNPKRRGGDAPLSGGRQQPVDESDGRGFVYVQRTRDRQAAATQARGASAGGGGAGEQGYSSSLETPSAAAETSATYAEVSFGPRSGAASAAFPADRSGLAPAKLLWHAEMETLLASSGFCSAAPGAEPAAEGERRVVPSAEGDECPDFLFYVDGFDADTELLLTVQATNWSLDASAQLVASAVSAEMVLALYPPLKIFPSSLVMLPGGHSLQLTIRGGPRHSARRRDEDLESDAQASRRRFTAIRRCESSDASVVAARAVEVLGAPVLAAFDARKLLLKVMTGDEEDDSPPDPREPVAQVVELVTGGEGSATLTVRVGDSSHDFPVAATSAASASSQFLGLRQAAATVQVIVALPARVVVGSRSRVPGGNRFVEAHRERVARFEANGPASAADPDGAAAHRDDADDTVRVGVHLTQRLHAFLYDAEGREFLFGHLAAPTGAVGDPGLDQETRGGQRRLQQLGVSASLPPPSASLCTYTWRAVKEDGATPVFGFVDARAIDLARGASRASSESCSNASAMPFLPAATTVRRTLSGTGEAASVSIVGLREGTARLHLRVQCAPREGAQTQRSRQVVLETEVSVVVSSLPLFASPTPSSALLQPASLTAHAGASSTSPASGPLSPLPLATPSGPAWWADLLAASPSSLSSLLVAPAAEYRLPCCRVRLVPAPAADAKPSASCPCSDGPAGPAVDAKASQAAAASQEASAPGAPGCACAPQAKAWAAALRVLAGDGGFVTGAAASSSVVRLEALPAASLALFGASLSPGERAKNNQTDDASRARAPTWTVVRVDVAPVANIELILKERTLQRGEKVTAHVVLKDREGRQIVSPTDLRIDVFSSHPSVVSAEVDLGRAFEPPAVLIQASSFLSGCAAVTVFLLSPATSSHFFADTVRLCTDSRVYPSDLPVAAVAETDGRRVSASRRLLALPGTAVHLLPEARVPVAQSPPHLSFRLTFRLESLLSSLLSLAMQERRGDRSLHEQPSPLFPAALWKRARETAYSPASPDCLSLLSVARLVDLFAPSLGESLHLSLSSVFASMRRKASAQAAVYSPAFSVGDPLIHFSDDAASTSAWFLHLKRGLCARHAPVGRAARASCATGTARCASESSPSFLPVSVSFRVTLHDLPAVLASLVFSEESERAASDEQQELPEVRLRVDGVDLLFSALRKRLAAAWWSEQAAYRQQTDSAGGERGPAKSSATLGGCANGSSADRRSFSPLSPFFSMTGFLDWSSSFSPSRRSASPALFAEYLSSSPFFECPQPALLWWQTSHPELLSVATPASATATRLAPAHATSPRLSAAGVDGPVAVAQRTGHATVFASHQSSVLDVEILSWREARDGEGDADARDPERIRVVAAAGCAARFARGDAESRRASLLAVPSTAWAPLREGAVTSLPRLERLGGCAEDRRNTGAAASSGGGEERSARPFALGRLGGSGDLGGDAGRSPAGELLFFRLQASQAAGGSWTDVASSVYVHSGGGIQCAVSDPRLAPLFVTESTQLPLLSLDVEAETGEESPTGSRMSGKARHGETATLSTLREDVDQLLVSHACAFQERRLLSVESDLPTLLRISQTSSSVAGAAGDGRAQRANPPGALPAGRLPCGAASLSAASSFRDDGRRAAVASPAPLLDSLSLPVSVSVSTGLAPSLLALSPASLAAFTEPDGGPEAGNASAEIALQRAKSRFLLRETPPAQLCAAIPYKPQMRVLFDSRYMRLDEPPVLYVGETQRMSAGCSAPGEMKETSEPASGGGGDRDDLFEEADVADSSSQCRRAAEGSGEEQGTAGAGFASVQESRAGEGAMLPLTVFVYPVPPVVSREGGASASAAEVSVDVGVSSDAYAVRAQQKGLLLAVRVEAALSRAAASPGDRRGGADSDREENASRAGRGYAWEAPESAQLTIESREWKQRLTLTLQRGRKVDRQRERAEEKREEQRLLFPPLLFSSSSSKLPAARRESEASGGGPHARPAPEESDAKGETSEQRERSDASGSLWEWTILLVLLIAGLVCVLPHVCGFCQRRSPQFSPCHPCGGPSPGTSAAIDSSPLFASTKATAQGPALILKEKARLETARMADAEALSCLFSASRFGGRGADLNCSVGRTPQQTLQMQPDGQWKWVAADQGEGSSQETLWRQEGSVARKHYS